jgi:hypothetical protein
MENSSTPDQNPPPGGKALERLRQFQKSRGLPVTEADEPSASPPQSSPQTDSSSNSDQPTEESQPPATPPDESACESA